jgi:hypothetical protein
MKLMPLPKIVNELIGTNEGMVITTILSELLQRQLMQCDVMLSMRVLEPWPPAGFLLP